MQSILSLPVTFILCALPVALALVIILRKRQERLESRELPFKNLRRRPAGETLRRDLLKLDEEINEDTLWLLQFPLFVAVFIILQKPGNPLIPLIAFLISAESAIYFGKKLWKKAETRADYQLGCNGERFVGEELSRLVLLGFEVYHDVQFDGFNIDHVLVGPRGVFVVETKAHRMSGKGNGKNKSKVICDGESLEWPWGTDCHEISRARDNAKALSDDLALVTGEKVWVTPILTFPGWDVERTVPSKAVHILQPDEIYDVCSVQPEKLTNRQTTRFCNYLDQKCRLAAG